MIILLVISVIVNLVLLIILFRINLLNTKPVINLFDINLNVTKKALIKADFKPYSADIPLLGKMIGDTMIYYHINYDCSDPTDSIIIGTDDSTSITVADESTIQCNEAGISWKQYDIKIPNLDSTAVIDLIGSYQVKIISDWTMSNPNFFVLNEKRRLIFKCSIKEDKYQHKYLSILYYYPEN